MTLRSWTRVAWLTVAILVMSVAYACGGATTVPNPGSDRGEASTLADLEPVSLGPDSKLKVVATTNIVGDVVAQVGGDQVELTTLMAIGVDPHSYVPTPSDTAAIHDAHVVFANGAGLESSLEEMVQAAGGTAIPVRLSDDLELLPLDHKQGAQAGRGGESAERVAELDDGHSVDPHVWLSVPNVIQWVGTIEGTLSAMDPENAGHYVSNARQYTATLHELDAWVKEQVATIPPANRTLVTSHPTFGYFAENYGLEQVGAVYPVSPSSDPSAREIAELEDAIRSHGVPAIFVETTVNPKLADQVARDTGAALVPLFTGSLGGRGSGVESYVDLMRFNTDAIVRALGQARAEP